VNVRRSYDESAWSVNGGVSSEPDYLSRFVGTGAQWDLNQKLTTINAVLAYTWSDIKATLDHDATPYIYNACGTARCNFASASSHIADTESGGKVMYGTRRDWTRRRASRRCSRATRRSRRTWATPTVAATCPTRTSSSKWRSSIPAQQFLSPSPDALYVDVGAIFEKRPDARRQWLANLRYAQYIEATDAALHVNYAYFSDDWGIRAHTLELEWAQPFANGWMLTPMARYYTQSAANFYTPYLVTDQGQTVTRTDPVTVRRRRHRSISRSCRPITRATIGCRRSARWAAGSRWRSNLEKGVTASLGLHLFPARGEPQVGRRRRRRVCRTSTGGC
jgi:hypothetical protein